MKLLLEAWKGYLASTKPIPQQDPNYPEEEEDVYGSNEEPKSELEQLETEFFGKNISELDDICNNLYEDYKKRGYRDTQGVSTFAQKYGQKIGLPIKYLGSGVYRATYSIANDLVLKIATNQYFNSAVKMNEYDYKLGTDSSINNITPRAYLHGNKYEWVLLERVTEIQNNYEAAKYFQSNLFPDVNSMSDQKKEFYFDIVLDTLEYYYNKNDNSRIAQYDSKVNNFDFSEKQKIPTFHEFRQDLYDNNKTYKALAKAVEKYKIYVREIRYFNIGYGSDGRFVMLDSSVF